MYSESIPARHSRFLVRALHQLQADQRFIGVAAAGSLASDAMDAYSDLDLVIAVEPAGLGAVQDERTRIAAKLGPLLAAFTGEHVGEPRLLICLYAGEESDQPLHVDLKFVPIGAAADSVDNLRVLWEREGRLTAALRSAKVGFPSPDLQWIEDRFWVWMHYGATKIGRGELFETLDLLAFLRSQALGPLILLEARARPMGVRRIEALAPARSNELQATVAAHDAAACATSLRAAADLYRSLRRSLGEGRVRMNHDAERAAMAYLSAVRSADSNNSGIAAETNPRNH